MIGHVRESPKWLAIRALTERLRDGEWGGDETECEACSVWMCRRAHPPLVPHLCWTALASPDAKV